MFVIDIDSLIKLAEVFDNDRFVEKSGIIRIDNNSIPKKNINIGYKLKKTYVSYESAHFEFIFWSDSGDIEDIIGKGNNFVFNLKFRVSDGKFCYMLEEAKEIDDDEKSINTWSKETIKHKNNVISTKKNLSCFGRYQTEKYRIPDYIQFFNYYKMGNMYNDMLKQITYPNYEYDRKLTFIKVQPNDAVIEYIKHDNVIECNYYDKIGTADVTINLIRHIEREDYFEAVVDIAMLVVNTIESLLSLNLHTFAYYFN